MGDLDLEAENLFNQWLKKPCKDIHGDYGCLFENIEISCIKMVKQAFLDAYKLGRSDKLNSNHQEQMQK